MRKTLSILRTLLVMVLAAIGPVPGAPTANAALATALLDRRARFPVGVVLTIPFSITFPCPGCCSGCVVIPFNCTTCTTMNPASVAHIEFSGDFMGSFDLPFTPDASHYAWQSPTVLDCSELWVRILLGTCLGFCPSGEIECKVEVNNIPCGDTCYSLSTDPVGSGTICLTIDPSGDGVATGSGTVTGTDCHGDTKTAGFTISITPLNGMCCE